MTPKLLKQDRPDSWPRQDSYSDVRGTQIDLKLHDNAIAGLVRDTILFASKSLDHPSMEIFLKINGSMGKAIIEETREGALEGTLTHPTPTGNAITVVTNRRVEGDLKSFLLEVQARGGNPVSYNVSVLPDEELDGVWKNPRFRIEIGEKRIEFKVVNMAIDQTFARHLVTAIFAVYFHN